ncbi:MAG TPA: anti-sigma factor [Vicinamibacteria bacterium]|jgi:hypothetical protein|nr:anti-sigma factor [Vicinamibacteria bacterium]
MSPHPTEQLSAYLDGELPDAERAAIEAHLRTCGACTRAVAEMRAIDAASRTLPLEAPEGYFEALPGRVRSRLQRQRTVPPRRALWAVAAAAVLAAVVSPFVLQRAATPPPQQAPAPAAPEAVPPATAPPATAAPKLSMESVPPAAVKEPPPALRRYAEARRVAPPATAAPPPAATPAPPAAPPPAAAQPRPQEERLEEKAAKQEAVVARDAARAAEPQAAPRDRMADRAAPARKAGAVSAPAIEEDYGQLAARRPTSAAEARALRDSWRAWAGAHPEGARGDEARVRALEAGAEAWRLGHDPRDLAQLRAEAAEYLQRADALQKDRVRALLAKAGG